MATDLTAAVNPDRRPHDPGRLSTAAGHLCLLAAVLVTLLTIYQVFNIGLLVDGYVFLENQILYLIIAFLLPLTFLIYPSKGLGIFGRLPDYALAAITLCIALYFVYNADNIVNRGWEYVAPREAVILSLVMWGIVVEATRRAGGWGLFSIVLLLSLYPVFADRLPAALSAHSLNINDVAIFHIMSAESLLGIPIRAFATLIIGFMIFGIALKHTGGGRFFLNLSFALLGHVRGGPAKVAIFSSGFMGSMSGSVITNVLTTGVLTIPAIRRVGFSRTYAAGVEACASTGGVLMPPIMGATAFVMATYLGVDYIKVAAAAVIPSVLYFFGLFCQIDARAARSNSRGLPREELPKVRETLKQGWFYIAVFVLLVWMLVVMNRESWAPYYATAALLALNQLSSATRWGLRELAGFWEGVGRLFVELVAILCGIGFIIGALVMTGKIGNIANDLLQLADGNVFSLLAMGAVTAFILGIGMTVTAAYIFLAIALAPALISGGLDPLSVHLFILYWGMLSYITPPVALGAFAAASVAGASPMKTGIEAMRLGSIIYAIPFFFILDPALILQGEWQEIVSAFVQVVAGIMLISAAIENYLIGIGELGRGLLGTTARALLALGGLAVALPGGGIVPIGEGILLAAGVIAVLVGLGFHFAAIPAGMERQQIMKNTERGADRV